MTGRELPGAPYDVVGVGFGPSNLALAVAVSEFNERVPSGRALRDRYLELQPRFGWHRGMLIEDATMQVSYLKDLATLRNPTSSFSFLSYLHARDRLVDFINYGSAFPTRIEFHDYLEWAAAQVADRVGYDSRVLEIEPVRADGGTRCLEVVIARPSGRVERMRTRNVVLATGLTPNLPAGVRLGERIWHNRDLVPRVAGLAARRPRRFVVVGAGQSAAETVDHLHRRFPSAQVCAVFARYGYSPADDSPFANRVFDPGAVDEFYRAPERVKRQILDYHSNTNYSVVDPGLIEQLYRKHYQEKVTGTERLRFLNVSRVTGTTERDDHVEIAVESMIDDGREVLTADAIVYATGYRSTDPAGLLGDLASSCERDAQGRLVIGRDYRVATSGDLQVGIYVQGATEHTHGISSTLLSNVAVRAGEIVAAVAAGRTGAADVGEATASWPERPDLGRTRTSHPQLLT